MPDPDTAFRPRPDSASTFWIVAASLALLLIGQRARHPGDPALVANRAAVRKAAAADDRGRSANSPIEIPAPGWKDILLRVFGNIGEHRILAMAAGATYYTLLAVFPALAAFVAIYGLFFDPATITVHLDRLSGVVPGGAMDIARDQLTRLSSKGSQALGLAFATGLAVSLWSANASIKALFDTLNIVYGEREKRGFIRLNAISLLFTLSAILFGLVAIAAIVVLPAILTRVGLSGLSDILVRVLRWPALFGVLTLALALVYRYGPSRDTARWRWITWGSAFAAFAWLIASLLFSWYAANFGTFNETYGTLGAVIGFMTWLWLSFIVVLIGAELDAEMEHQTARDTTTGARQPIGARGAAMADTVGPTHGA